MFHLPEGKVDKAPKMNEAITSQIIITCQEDWEKIFLINLASLWPKLFWAR